MSKSNFYLLVSLPTSISSSADHDEAFGALQATVSKESESVAPFTIPEFKIGTLDALVQQADDLAKLEGHCEAVANKVGDSLKAILEGDENKIAQQKSVNDKPVDAYLRNFNWNKVKYRADRPIGNLIDILQKEITSIDNDVKTKYNQYNQIKTNLNALQKRQTGNLSNKSLTSIVPPEMIVKDSEYIETHLVAVPAQNKKEFIKSYETLSGWIVPRSATQVASDDEFVLYAVTVFKKYSHDFIHKCREHKWVPRDYKFKEGGRDEEQKELEKSSVDERKLWGEVLRLARTNWGEAVMAWIHVLVLRVFVETVLRYGLPLAYVCGLIKTTSKQNKKVRDALDANYGYLAGNAIGRDKKGRAIKDNSAEMQTAGADDYSAYVCYDFEIN